jgi:dihydrofolate synthase / folylpolyglutamate synthase
MVDEMKGQKKVYTQLAVLTKAPHIGTVKTRLTPALSHWQALQFHRWSLSEVVERLCPAVLNKSPLLFSTHQHDFWRTLSLDHPPLTQCEGNLGVKMKYALLMSFHLSTQVVSPRDAVMLLGTDAPTLSPKWLKDGFDYLTAQSEPAIVIGPAEDGGYYSIGCNRACLPLIDELFVNEIKWGTAEVFFKSKEIALSLVTYLKILPVGCDVDHPEDLARARLSNRPRWSLYDELSTPSELSAPKTLDLRQAYEKALSYLFSLTRFGERFDLSAPRAINQALGEPLNQFKSLLIGGTNGKGSTCQALNQLAQTAHLSVGCFTSPHLVCFRERIRIGDELISPQEVVDGVKAVCVAAKAAQVTLSFFEATWALAAWFFRERQVDWVIWEVGLGGRLDATNICEPVLSAICSISLDHTHILGDSLEAIALEKTPIYRSMGIALTSCEGQALDALFRISPVTPNTIDQELAEIETLYETSLASDHAEETMIATIHGRRNLALAWSIARSLKWLNVCPKVTLTQIKWSGRLEYLEGIWLDCAHNAESARQLTRWLKKQDQPRHLVVGMSADKAIVDVLLELASECEHITFVSPTYPRCTKAENLAKVYVEEVSTRVRSSPCLYAEETKIIPPSFTVTPSLVEALVNRNVDVLTLVTGSCFLVGEARAWLLGVEFPELGIITTAR